MILFVASAALLFEFSRHLTFFYDEWNFVLQRRGGSLATYLDPHNGHFSLFPVVVYKILFKLVGLRHYTPYIAVLIALHLLICFLLYVFVRRRLGPWLALAPTCLLLFMGTAYQDLLWAFQIGYLGSIAGGMAALVLMENRTLRSNWLACGALVWAITSSGTAIPFVIAVAVWMLADGTWRERWWVVLIPALVFGAWYIGWGGGEGTSASAIGAAPEYVATAAGAAASGIAGLDTSWGPALIVLLVVAIATEWRREQRLPTPALLAAAAGGLSFWLLSAVVRSFAGEPGASRYLYIGALFIWLGIAEVRLGRRLKLPGLVLGGLLVLAAVVSNINTLHQGMLGLKADDANVRAALAAVEIARPVVAPSFQPSPVDAPQVTAGPYLAAASALGSPAPPPSQLPRVPEAMRVQADQVLEAAERLAIVGASSGSGPTAGVLRPLTATGGRATTVGGCVRFAPASSAASVEVAATPGQTIRFGAAGGAAGTLALRRFADAYAPALGSVAAGASQLRLPADLAPSSPWYIRLTTGTLTTLCLS